LGRGPLARVPFVDLDRIEVMRGPQNVLFGKNAIAGALAMVTAKPTDELSTRVLLEYEPEYDTTLATGVISGRITEEFGAPHVVINNAGISAHGSFLNTPMDVARRDSRGTFRKP
jgi:outer membrane receptor protein involved in Fe transport